MSNAKHARVDSDDEDSDWAWASTPSPTTSETEWIIEQLPSNKSLPVKEVLVDRSVYSEGLSYKILHNGHPRDIHRDGRLVQILHDSPDGYTSAYTRAMSKLWACRDQLASSLIEASLIDSLTLKATSDRQDKAALAHGLYWNFCDLLDDLLRHVLQTAGKSWCLIFEDMTELHVDDIRRIIHWANTAHVDLFASYLLSRMHFLHTAEYPMAYSPWDETYAGKISLLLQYLVDNSVESRILPLPILLRTAAAMINAVWKPPPELRAEAAFPRHIVNGVRLLIECRADADLLDGHCDAVQMRESFIQACDFSEEIHEDELFTAIDGLLVCHAIRQIWAKVKLLSDNIVAPTVVWTAILLLTIQAEGLPNVAKDYVQDDVQRMTALVQAWAVLGKSGPSRSQKSFSGLPTRRMKPLDHPVKLQSPIWGPPTLHKEFIGNRISLRDPFTSPPEKKQKSWRSKLLLHRHVYGDVTALYPEGSRVDQQE